MAPKSDTPNAKRAKKERAKLDLPIEKMGSVNVTHLKNMIDNISTILDHPVFEDVATAAPRAIKASDGMGSGHQAVYDEKQFVVAMAETGRYKCAGNLLWLDYFWTATPKVPLRASSISSLKNHYFATPVPYPGELMIAIQATEKPSTMFGRLQGLSPEEMRFALIERIAERITANAGMEELQDWRTTLLTVSLHFRDLTADEEIHIEAIQLREHLVVEYSAMARTAKQWIYTVMSLRQDVEKTNGKMDDQAFAVYIEGHLTIKASVMDDISANFIKSCRNIYDVLFCHQDKRVQQAMDDMEEEFGMQSPLNHVAKLALLVKYAGPTVKHRDALLWVLSSMKDAVQCGLIPANAITYRSLKGEGSNPGLPSLWLFKYEMLEHLKMQMQSKVFPATVKTKMMEVYNSHADFRAHVPLPSASGNADLSWQSSWPTSSMQMGRLLEEVAYGKEYDPTMKFAVKNKKSVEEVLEMAAFSEIITSIDECLEAENEAGKADDEKDVEPVDVEEGDDDDDIENTFAKQYVEKVEDVNAETRAEISKHKVAAERFVQQLVLRDEPSTATAFKELLESELKNASSGDTSKLLDLVFYDAATSGEAVTNPQTRKPPLRQHYHKLMSGVVGHYCAKNEFPDNLAIIVFNAGKEGHNIPIPK
jgi:hypothetical protein